MARVRTNTVTLAEADDVVTLAAYAVRAFGGDGGNGGTAGFTGFDPGGPHSYDRTAGTVGTDGADGVAGLTRLEMVGNRVILGAGSDTLHLGLGIGDGEGGYLALNAGTGGNFAFNGNAFQGGDGVDRLDLTGRQVPRSDGTRSDLFDLDGLRGAPAVVDVARSRLSLAGSAENMMTGFEHFTGTLSNDLFLDGRGNHSYASYERAAYPVATYGDDTFEFRTGHGDDTVLMDAGDVIRLIGFGPTLDSFEEVMARATDAEATIDVTGAAMGAGVVVATDAQGSSLTLHGLSRATLTSDMFAFS